MPNVERPEEGATSSELELMKVYAAAMWPLRTNPGSSAKAARALHHWTIIFPASPSRCCLEKGSLNQPRIQGSASSDPRDAPDSASTLWDYRNLLPHLAFHMGADDTNKYTLVMWSLHLYILSWMNTVLKTILNLKFLYNR